MSSTTFRKYFAANYTACKAQYPTEGRRQLRLRVLQNFWSLSPQERSKIDQDSQIVPPDPSTADLDPHTILDEVDGPVRRRGVIVRTDFTDDANWAQFITTVTESVQSVLSDLQGVPTETEVQNMDEDGDESSGEESSEDDTEMISAAVGSAGASVSQLGIDAIFVLVNEPTLLDASNIRLLRTFVDVDVVPCPARAASVKPIKGRNPLVDWDGLQEVYEGRLVWVYDAETVKTGSVRLISGRQKTYGVATGDSWRVRSSFIPELQLNLDAGAISIDFGGEDRWTYAERQRNFAEIGLGP